MYGYWLALKIYADCLQYSKYAHLIYLKLEGCQLPKYTKHLQEKV